MFKQLESELRTLQYNKVEPPLPEHMVSIYSHDFPKLEEIHDQMRSEVKQSSPKLSNAVPDQYLGSDHLGIPGAVTLDVWVV